MQPRQALIDAALRLHADVKEAKTTQPALFKQKVMMITHGTREEVSLAAHI